MAAQTFSGLTPRNPFMEPLWLRSLDRSLGNAEIMAAFREATGNQYRWEPGQPPIDLKAHGAFLRAFAEWHNAHVWGRGRGW